MFAEHPEMAKEWASKTPDIKKLPEHVGDKKKKKPNKLVEAVCKISKCKR